MPKISVIVINFNGRQVIMDCLRSLEKQIWKDFEIILVDNGSSDGSLGEIRDFSERSTLAGQIQLVPLERNRGFTGGSIAGLEKARAEYVALLNNDTEPNADWLENLFASMEHHPDVGICASKILCHGTNIIDSAGDGYSTLLKGFKRGEGESSDKFTEQEFVFGACAGAALYRRAMLRQIGFLDDDFFLIHEDTDINFRAQLAGWKVLYVPSAVVYHKVRTTIGMMSDVAIYYTLRNNEFVRIKNMPMSLLFRCLPPLLLGLIAEFLYFAVMHRKMRLYLRAKADVMNNLRSMIHKRRQVRQMVRADTAYLYSMMTPILSWTFLSSRVRKFFFS